MKSRTHLLGARLAAVAMAALASLALGATMALAQTTYTWNQTGTAAWTTATNWTPTRTTPATNDILVFNNGATTTVTGVSTQTIGQLSVSGTTTVSLQPASGVVTLTIGGDTGPDLSVDAGSALNLSGGTGTTNVLKLVVATGATGSISGSMTFSTANHNMDAADAAGITFNSGATFTQNCSGNAFTNAGTANAVVFASGSTLNFLTGSNPFGLGQPSSKVVFQAGSLYSHQSSNTPAFSGRTYANFELKVSGTISGTGSAALSIDNLTVTTGTLNLGMTGTFNLKGNVTAGPGTTLNFNPASVATVTLNGSSAQTITNNGTFSSNERETFNVNNPNGVDLGSNLTIGNATTGTSGVSFTSGRINTGANTLTIGAGANLSGASPGTGWVNGNLQRTVVIAAGAGSQTWQVGDASIYAPIDFSTTSGFTNLVLTGSTTPGEHPNVGGSGIDATKDVNRWYTLATNSGSFGSADLVFHFDPADVDGGANTNNFYVKKYDSPTWTSPTTGTRGATTTQATGVTGFSDFAIGEPSTHTITATAGPGGSISPAGPVQVADGGSQTFNIAPADKCHAIADVLVDNVPVGAVASYTFNGVVADHTIDATFSTLGPFTITASAAAGGTISPSGPTSVNCGDGLTFTITPGNCAAIADVQVDNVSVGPVASYTFTDVQANHTIFASFSAITSYTITATAGAGGSISPSGAVLVNCGGNPTFSIQPDACHTIADVLVDNVSVGPVASYTFNNVQANHTISATFDPIVYTFTASAGPNGSIFPSGSVSIPCDGSQKFDIVPDSCYHIASVLVDGNPIMFPPSGPFSIEFQHVQSSRTISATFALDSYAIMATAQPGGTISPSGAVSVACGASQTFDIAPAGKCQVIADVKVDNASVGPVTSYTFNNVHANHTIEASFTPLGPFTITATAGAGGAISPSGPVSVACGGSQTFSIAGDGCHTLANVSVDGVSIGPAASYTFSDVQANHTIDASFVADSFTITVNVVGSGSVSISPDLPRYACGTSVVIIAVPAPGFGFQAWGGDFSGSSNPIKVTLGHDTKVTAIFVDATPPSVTVNSPNGGEIILVGSTTKLDWTATDNTGIVTGVDLWISRDNGATWEKVASNVPNTGTYSWLVTPPGTNVDPDPAFTALFKVDAHDGANLTGTDTSDGPFALYDLATAAMLSMFQASAVGDGIELRWRLGDPRLFTSLTIERSESETGPWIEAALDRREEGGVMVALDRAVQPERTYFYRLVGTSHDNQRVVLGQLSGSAHLVIRDFTMARVAPNPSRGPMRIEYALPRESRVRLSVVDVQGREVAVLADGLFQAGRYQTTWSGMTDRGAAPAGVYFVRCRALGKDLSQRIVRTR